MYAPNESQINSLVQSCMHDEQIYQKYDARDKLESRLPAWLHSHALLEQQYTIETDN